MPLIVKIGIGAFILLFINANLLSVYFEEKTRFKRKLEEERTHIFLLMMFFSVFFTPFPNLMKKIRIFEAYKRNIHIFKPKDTVVSISNKRGLTVGTKHKVQQTFDYIGKVMLDKSTTTYPSKLFVSELNYRKIKINKLIRKTKRWRIFV